MATSLEDMLDRLPAKRRKKIEREAAQLAAEYLTLQQLRKAQAITQVELAERLGVRQATIAQMEKRSDMLLSTLRNTVRAMGGDLKVTVEFPDKEPVVLDLDLSNTN